MAGTAARRRAFAATSGAGEGVAIGWLWRTDPPVAPGLPADSTVDGQDALTEAFTVVAADLGAMASDLALRGQPEAAQIVEATFLIAADPDLRSAAAAALAAGASPAEAVEQAAEHFAAVLAQLPDSTLAGRTADVRSVGRRLVSVLSGVHRGAPPSGPLVLVGHEVTADDLLLHADVVVAALTVLGGATSHAAIIARSLGIPILFGIEPALVEVSEETEVLVDASTGQIVLRPDPRERAAALVAAARVRERRAELAANRDLPVRTRDGVELIVQANVASLVDADLALAMGAAGVGLLRTEMPFLAAEQWPSRAEHLAQLSSVLRRLAGLPVTVRTLDFADDKLPPFLRRGASGPLGRSLPLMLREGEAFRQQVLAILTAGQAVDLQIMIPMVASAEELRTCQVLVADAAAELGVEEPPVGAMIELPEAVAAVSEIAAVAGFLALGTNDLTASVLGLGRRDPALTTARVTEPAVLDAIAATVRAGAARGIPVSVCGDAASDAAVLPALLAAGCRIFSVPPSMLDEVRTALRSASLA